MRHLSILILTVALAATACGKKGDDSKRSGEATRGGETAEPATPPAPYDGPLTAERMKQAKDTVKPFQKWDAAYATLLSIVGKPTEVDGNNHNWYLLVGDKCHELSVENANGEVGAVGLGEYDKIMKSKFEKCQPGGDDEAGGNNEAGEGDEAGDGDEPA